MNKDKEIAYYRKNIINKYITEAMNNLKNNPYIPLRKDKIDITLFKPQLKVKRKNKSLPILDDPDLKCCKICEKIKPLSEFYKNPLKHKGVFDYCKECVKTKNKQRREYVKTNNERERSLKNAVPAE